MKILEVTVNKKQYLDLLLLADEQEDMIDLYLDKGRMYVLDDNGIKCECVLTDEGNGVLEITEFDINPGHAGLPLLGTGTRQPPSPPPPEKLTAPWD